MTKTIELTEVEGTSGEKWRIKQQYDGRTYGSSSDGMYSRMEVLNQFMNLWDIDLSASKVERGFVRVNGENIAPHDCVLHVRDDVASYRGEENGNNPATRLFFDQLVDFLDQKVMRGNISFDALLVLSVKLRALIERKAVDNKLKGERITADYALANANYSVVKAAADRKAEADANAKAAANYAMAVAAENAAAKAAEEAAKPAKKKAVRAPKAKKAAP